MQAELWAPTSEQLSYKAAACKEAALKAAADEVVAEKAAADEEAPHKDIADGVVTNTISTDAISKSALMQSTLKKAAVRERARAAEQQVDAKLASQKLAGQTSAGQKKIPESLYKIISRRDTWMGRADLDYRLAEPSIDSPNINAKAANAAANAANNDLHYHQQIPTGFAPLDARLCEQGWPLGTCIEVMSDASGMGAMGLFLPAMEKLNRQQRWQAFIAPPYAPYAPLLAARGIDTQQVLLVHPQDREEILWSTEQALRSETCSAVFSWLGTGEYRYAELRRLQLAAARGNTLAVLFRSQDAVHQHAPAALRLQMSAYRQVHILKQRSGLQGIDVYLPPEDDIPNQPQLWELPRDMATSETRAAC